MPNELPIIKLSDAERLWMEEVYKRNLQGVKFTYKEIRSKLHSQLPIDFRPVAMDERLISSNGEEIKVLGVVALQKTYQYCKKLIKLLK